MNAIPARNRAISRKLPFAKLEGLGNCYLFVERKHLGALKPAELARRFSDTATGVGSDGLIVIDSASEPVALRIFNSDGSEAEMCGNGLRQAALYLDIIRRSRKKRYLIAPPAGIFRSVVLNSRRRSAVVETELGKPEFSCASVGLRGGKKAAFSIPLNVGAKRYIADCVSFGNPHAVVFVKNFDFDWIRVGKSLAEHRLFRRGANVHFVKIENRSRFSMRIYERGSGPTMACGSGAAASLAVGVMRDFLTRRATASMPGGKLKLEWDFRSGKIIQIGPVNLICIGELLI